MTTAEGDAETIDTLDARLEEAIETAAGLREQVEKLARQVEASRMWRWFALFAAGLIAIVVVGIIYASVSITHEDLILQRETTIGGLDRQIVNQLCEARQDVAIAAHQSNPSVVISLPATPECAAFTP